MCKSEGCEALLAHPPLLYQEQALLSGLEGTVTKSLRQKVVGGPGGEGGLAPHHEASKLHVPSYSHHPMILRLVTEASSSSPPKVWSKSVGWVLLV